MNVAGYIDHTLLKPNATLSDIRQLCAEAIEYGFAAVCIPPFYVKEAVGLLGAGKPKVATVIGFPMGYSATPAKVEEIKKAIDDGADELDVVINLCALKSENWNYVRNDIDSVCTAVHLKGKVIKIILETGLLEEDEIRQLCAICLDSKPDFVKTSTGMNGPGASLEAVALLRQEVGGQIKIKASGGIRTPEQARLFIEAGAARLGASAGVALLG